jgi:hypothetical protein
MKLAIDSAGIPSNEEEWGLDEAEYRGGNTTAEAHCNK